MSYGNRGILAALAGLAALATSFGLGAYTVGLTEIEQERSASSDHSKAANSEPPPPFDSAGVAPPPASDLRPGADGQAYYDREDLTAQREMAVWTKRMGQAAILGVILSVIGVWLIWRTWEATKAAAGTSERTYRAFIALERAKLTVSISDVIYYQGGQRGVDLRVSNIGKSHCTVTLAGYLWTDSKAWEQNGVVISARRDVFVPAGESREIEGAPETILDKNRRVHGYIRYTDSVGERRSFFAFSTWRDKSRKVGAVPIRPKGMPEDT